MGDSVEFVPVSFCKLLKAQADRMVKKTLECYFQTIFNSVAHLSTEFRRDVSGIKKTGQTIFKKLSADYIFQFFQFLFVVT